MRTWILVVGGRDDIGSRVAGFRRHYGRVDTPDDSICTFNNYKSSQEINEGSSNAKNKWTTITKAIIEQSTCRRANGKSDFDEDEVQRKVIELQVDSPYRHAAHGNT